MKLEEARKLATPGPYRVQFHATLGQSFITGTRTVEEAIRGRTPLNSVAAHYLVHAGNMLPELVEALDSGQEIADSVAGNFDNGNDFDRALEALTEWAMNARALLAKASEVPEI